VLTPWLSENNDEPSSVVQLPITVECTDEGDKQFTMENQLTNEQRQRLLSVLERFQDLLSEIPGRTDLVELRDQIGQPYACRQP